MRRYAPLSIAAIAGTTVAVITAGVVALIAVGCAGVTQDAQQWVSKETTSKGAWASLAQQWIPPTAANSSTALFPDRADTYTLGSKDGNDSVENLGVSGNGQHIHYLGSGASFDLYAYQAGPGEAATVFKQVIRSVTQQRGTYVGPISYRFVPAWAQKNGKQTGPVYSASRLSYSVASPSFHGSLWWEYGWLFLAQTKGSADSDAFLRGYLQNVSSASGPSFSISGFKMPNLRSHLGGFHFHI